MREVNCTELRAEIHSYQARLSFSFAATRQWPAREPNWRVHLAGHERQRAWSTTRSPTQRRARTSLSPAAEGEERGPSGACPEMAAVAVSSAKRSLRAELKQRLRALSAEERLRQSHLLTQKLGGQGRAEKEWTKKGVKGQLLSLGDCPQSVSKFQKNFHLSEYAR